MSCHTSLQRNLIMSSVSVKRGRSRENLIECTVSHSCSLEIYTCLQRSTDILLSRDVDPISVLRRYFPDCLPPIPGSPEFTSHITSIDSPKLNLFQERREERRSTHSPLHDPLPNPIPQRIQPPIRPFPLSLPLLPLLRTTPRRSPAKRTSPGPASSAILHAPSIHTSLHPH